MVNSSWTQAHVNGLLGDTKEGKALAAKADRTPVQSSKTAKIVYPPCDTKSLSSLSLEGREDIILSLAQFRYARLPAPCEQDSR